MDNHHILLVDDTKAIAVCEGNILRAAALLEISPYTIYRKKMVWDKSHGPSPVRFCAFLRD